MNPWERYILPNLMACACGSKPMMKQREKIIPLAEGVVLEVGCGSGTNFPYYDPDKIEHLYALEPCEGMLIKARRAAGALGFGNNIEFLQAGAEAVPLEDDSVDTVVFTFVLCTIPDWKGALAEARRVLKPGGRVIFSEHGLAPDEDVAKWQHRVETVWKPLAGGCHLTRSTRSMLEEAGFKLQDEQEMYLPSTPKVLGYAAWGVAVPA